LFIDLDLEPDAPFEADRCGTCTRCLEACPTGAIVEPRVLDATRCISYLTIETRGAIPEEFRDRIGSLIYGCDICQDVCPWNVSFSRDVELDALKPRDEWNREARTLAREFLSMDEMNFRTAFKGSAMKRAKLRGLKRNAATVLGNLGSADDLHVLKSLDTGDAMIQEHVLWATGQIRSRAEGSE